MGIAMSILAIDMGTGTQDILIFDSAQPVENSLQMIMPSATEIAAGRIRRATKKGRPVLLTGVTMGGGPCHWALEDHLRAGGTAFATPEAARTFDDDLSAVAGMGVTVVSEDEARGLKAHAVRVEMRDLDLAAIRRSLAAFDVDGRFDGLALACLDHGAAPPGYSDRLFRFEHLRRVVAAGNDLRSFAYLPDEVPQYLTRARTMLACASAEGGSASGGDEGIPTVFLDTGPAAALGALQDPQVAGQGQQFLLNLGNMHALAFHLRGTHIYSLYEHHTGEVTGEQLEDFSERLMAGTLAHEDVFDSKGHGVFYADQPKSRRPFVAVTGPQRGKLRGSRLQPYFAVPHGDMMISGCFGLTWAFAEKHRQHREEIISALGLDRSLVAA
ncbi:MAG: pyruvate formate lyase-activating protein [Chloroflexi bacterium]|nr:pyruvate formate lyase-activating protein [Chloroflexota bacterium]